MVKKLKKIFLLFQIDGNIKDERSKKIIELSDKFQKEYNESFVGKQVEVLFEELKDGVFKGHTKNYLSIHFKTNQNLENKLQNVICQKAEKDYIIA